VFAVFQVCNYNSHCLLFFISIIYIAPSRLGNQQLNEAQDEDDDIPLARLQHSLQQNHLADASAQPLSARFLSAHNNHADHGESAYDADSDRQSDCTNPSDEEEAHDMMAIAGTPQQERISNGSLSTPNTRLGRSHTFGFSRLSNTRKSMSAGEGHPHNWINGFEDEEEDIVSNPSDEEEAELHHLQRVSDLLITYILCIIINSPLLSSCSSTDCHQILLA
jgi:hypothetical protein